ncbi:MAG TPA: cell envelope integrity protein TolA [Nitrospira sp.]|nr:cell envelope integrity protein TolA [Nitrospira sp.]
MERSFHEYLLVFVCGCSLLSSMLISPGFGVPASVSASTAPSGKRWARFELDQASATGDLQTGKAVTLGITLGGVAQGSVPVVAICESILFESQTVTLEPDGNTLELKGTVTLEPMPMSLTSVHPKAARIQVTFARFRQDKFERFMRRIVYVTMDRQESAGDSADAPAAKPEEPAVAEPVTDESQANALPISEGDVAEEDLMPLADPAQGKAYWKHVSHIVSRSWARQVREVKRGASGETVRVRFQLYPSGRAQLIEIEKGSGAREIDEAGIYAVVNAQPFPPFPPELGDDAVDVHVRMRTGARPRPRDVQSVTSQSATQPDAPASKK